MRSFLLSFLILISTQLLSQAKLIGTISDSTSNESLIGAVVYCPKLNTGTVSDIDGKFELILPTGSHEIEVRYVTYLDYSIKVNIVESNPIGSIVIKMKRDDKTDSKELKIFATRDKDTQVDLILTQKNSSSVVDGTTSEIFKKTPDSKASDVLKRISGASIQDNKFVIIRGLNDRYNFGLINGSPLPSSESDKRAFSFDIFSSNMIDNILIQKTASSDLPGEFAGGIININTQEIKDNDFSYVQIGQSYNTISTFRNFNTYNGSKGDFIGFGSDYRSLPNGLPSTEEFSDLNKNEKAELSKLIKNDWSTKNIKSPLNQNLQFGFGRNWKIRKDKSSFGFVFNYNYQLNYNQNNIVRKEFEESETEVITKMILRDSVFTQNVLNTGLLNFKFKINDKNSIKFKNLYSINSEDKVNKRYGVREIDNDPHQWEKSTNLWYTQNNLLTQQLIGNHEFSKSKIEWSINHSDIKREIPNLRRIVYRKYSLLENDPNEEYVAVIQTNGTIPTAAGNMFWSKSNEKVYGGRVDYAKDLEISQIKSEIKSGYFFQYRNRDFTSRNFGFSQYRPTGSTFNSELLLLNTDEIFSIENMGLLQNGQGGFKLDESTNVDDSYDANSTLNAGYLMIDTKTKNVNLNVGLRIESYNQRFNYIEFGSNLKKTIDSTVVDLLPSINLSFNVDKFKVRTSYSKTVSRPEFRELAPFSFYNFIQDNITSGNPYLKRTIINNYDLRFEYYPSNSQVFSVSGFYKEFINPIEIINRTGTSGSPELYYDNVYKAKNIGVEIDIKSKIYKNLSINSNLAFIKSNVMMDEIIGSGGNRPLQGQSPYVFNTGLYWNNTDNTFSTNISYNIVGPRIYIVGNVQEPSVWENERHVLDFQISKKIKNCELKLNIKDILAQDLIYFQDLNNNQRFNLGDNDWQKVQFGQTITLSAKFNF